MTREARYNRTLLVLGIVGMDTTRGATDGNASEEPGRLMEQGGTAAVAGHHTRHPEAPSPSASASDRSGGRMEGEAVGLAGRDELVGTCRHCGGRLQGGWW